MSPAWKRLFCGGTNQIENISLRRHFLFNLSLYQSHRAPGVVPARHMEAAAPSDAQQKGAVQIANRVLLDGCTLQAAAAEVNLRILTGGFVITNRDELRGDWRKEVHAKQDGRGDYAFVRYPGSAETLVFPANHQNWNSSSFSLMSALFDGVSGCGEQDRLERVVCVAHLASGSPHGPYAVVNRGAIQLKGRPPVLGAQDSKALNSIRAVIPAAPVATAGGTNVFQEFRQRLDEIARSQVAMRSEQARLASEQRTMSRQIEDLLRSLPPSCITGSLASQHCGQAVSFDSANLLGVLEDDFASSDPLIVSFDVFALRLEALAERMRRKFGESTGVYACWRCEDRWRILSADITGGRVFIPETQESLQRGELRRLFCGVGTHSELFGVIPAGQYWESYRVGLRELLPIEVTNREDSRVPVFQTPLQLAHSEGAVYVVRQALGL